MQPDEKTRKELEEKILSKRQQVEFERTNLDTDTALSAENRENPEVMEEAKNYNDPAQSVLNPDEVKSLKSAEDELNDLLRQLEALNKP